MRGTAALVVGCGLATAVAGCDWRTFDDIQGQTPVLNLGAPSGFGASDNFGQVVLPIAAPTGGAARYLVSATSVPTLALVDLDPAGNPHSQALDPPPLTDAGAYPVTALGASPDGKQVLLGAPSNGHVYLMTADTTTTVLFASSAEEQFGMGVAVAPLAGQAAPDFVVASSGGLHVYLDGSASAPPLDFASTTACPLLFMPQQGEIDSRPVAVVGQVVAVGTPIGGGGTISLFQVSATAITCLGMLSAAEGVLGRSLAVADFDGDGNPDLLAGAPPRNAYLFKGPLVAGTAPAASITYADSAGRFGTTVAAGDVDGKPGAEALIADPETNVSGKVAAGSVVVYSGPALATKKLVLAAHDPGDGQAYGTSVNVLPFCAQPPCAAAAVRGLALVGSATRTFTYFKLEADDTDPRKR